MLFYDIIDLIQILFNEVIMKAGEIWKNRKIEAWAKIVKLTVDSVTLYVPPSTKMESMEVFVDNIKIDEYSDADCVVYKLVKIGDGSTDNIGTEKLPIRVDGEEFTVPCKHFYQFWYKFAETENDMNI